MFKYEDVIANCEQYFNGDSLAAKVVVDKYLLKDNDGNLVENGPEMMHRRIAKEFARIEKKKFKEPLSEEFIFSLLDRFKYIIPQGSPMFGIGNDYQVVSLSNCFLLDEPLDNYNSILDVDKQLVNISKRRGGVGIDLSNLRPAGAPVKNAAKAATGIVSWMERYSNSIREVGQCVKSDSLVLTRFGLKKIKDVAPQKDEVWTKDGWVKVLEVLNNGVKNCYEVASKSGLKISATNDHVFKTFNENGELEEKTVGEFKVGDGVVLCNSNSSIEQNYVKLNRSSYKNVNNKPANCILPDILNEKLAYVLGYSYGNGHVTVDEFGSLLLSLAAPDERPDVKAKLDDYINSVFNYQITYRNGDGALEVLSIHNKTIVQFLEHNSLLKQKSKDIIFPENILKSPISVQTSFLSGYFDADGYASGKKKGYCFTSISRGFLSVTQLILSTMGISSKIHVEDRSELGWSDLYSLCVVGGVAQEKIVNLFTESIKIQAKRHISKRDCWLTPFKAKSFGINHNKYSYCPDNTQFLSTSTINRLALDGNKVLTTLYQDKIASIKEVGEFEVYDLVLEKEHLFWCQGFYVHNCNRRGALMLTISINHPDIIDFCTIKNDPTKVTGANISVRLNKEFLDAVKNNTDYELRWPINSKKPKISKMVSAKKVWDIIINSAHSRAEPGLLMWDNVIKETPADYYEAYASKGCNPCSELVLANLDSCRLLVLNLLSYVLNPYIVNAKFDFKTFHQHAKIAQRLMDNLVDLESEKVDKIIEKIQSDPEPEDIKSGEISMWRKIKKLNDEGRRTGTGITALGDTIAALNVKYGSEESIKITGDIYKALKLAAYESSVDMAEELGHFVGWSHEAEKDCPFIDRMKIENRELYEKMSKIGRRNVSLTTTAPTGSLSILTQTTSGIEPLFMIGYTRRRKINPEESANKKVDFVDQNGDKWEENTVYHAQIANWMKITGKTDVKESPWYGACAEEIDWVNRVKLQAEAQLHTCHSISSTLNLPEDVSKETVATIYQTAFESGCKGITVYRKNCRTGVLIEKPEKKKEESLIIQTSAPKRPKSLSCDVHHLNYDSKRYYAVVGLLNNAPYEIFVGVNSDSEGDVIIPKSIKSGNLSKEARKKYILENSESRFSCNISNGHSDENADVLGRLISTSLRHGTPIEFIVHQLEKTHGGLTSFSKVLCRTLKKYIKDGTKVSGEKCPGCGSENIQRNSGCSVCLECGHSACK